ncbi:MAG: dihydropteroate synthase [Prevotella sp.]|nr:dihydropteroate synthase [Prevotella sp.]
MSPTMDYTLNCNGHLLDLSTPQVMGILNATPDSFFAASRTQTEREIANRTEEILQQGGTIIDVGACSTRPDSKTATEAEEEERLRLALKTIRIVAPNAIVSVDTFRPQLARMAVEEYGVAIVNDVGAPVNNPEVTIASQKDMFRMVSRLRVPYLYMSRKSNIKDILLDSAEVVDVLRSMGQKDIIIDPGFGFGKTVEENYEVMNGLERLQMLRLPILVALSRKSMIYRLLESTQEQALAGTIALNTIGLMKGADILRVHDVKEAVDCVKIVKSLEIKDKR